MKNSRATLFFRASAGYSKLLNNKEYIFGTVNSGNPLFFRASASCSKIQNVKVYSIQRKISGQLCFSGQALVAQKSRMIKNTCSNTVKNFRVTLFFQGKRKLLKNCER